MMKKFVLVLTMILAFTVPAFATTTGGIPISMPAFTVGYQNTFEAIVPFTGTPALFALNASTNLQIPDRAGSPSGNTLWGDPALCQTVSTFANTRFVVLGHQNTFTLTPGSGTAPFPMIWVKKTYANSNSGKAGKSFDDPSDLLTGSNVANYHMSGLAIQAPYYVDSMTPATNWQVFVYADKDILTGITPAAGAGRILDPRLATLRWFAWAASADQTGMAAKQWKMNTFDGTTVGSTEFNTMPLINSVTASVIKGYLIGANYAETTLGPILDYATSLPTDTLGYNRVPRETPVHINGFKAEDKNVGLVYVAPPRIGPTAMDPDLTRYRNQKLHVQFVAYWPAFGVPAIVGNGCNISIYQRTDS